MVRGASMGENAAAETMMESTPQEAVGLSIIVCTRNRAELLRLCLDALVCQDGAAPDAYEVLVVDNGSTDRTRQVVESARQRCERIRYLYEERLGLSIARNAGVARAAGRIVCFVDDDAVASSDFVREILRSFEDPEVACVAGKIVASWPDGVVPVVVRAALRKRRRADLVRRNDPLDEKERISLRGQHVVSPGDLPATGRFRREPGQKRREQHLGGGNRPLPPDAGERAAFSLQSALVRQPHRRAAAGRRNGTSSRASSAKGSRRDTRSSFTGAGRFSPPTCFSRHAGSRRRRRTTCSAGSFLSEAARFRLRCTISWYAGYLHFLAVRDDLGSVVFRRLRSASRDSDIVREWLQR